MRFAVVVLHNVSDDMFFRYRPKTSALHHAHTFDVEADNLRQAGELVWILTNVGSADELRLSAPHLSRYAEAVEHYRRRQNRSLSVGDVLLFSEEERPAGALTVAMVGFDRIDGEHLAPRFIERDNSALVSQSYEAHQALQARH